MLTEEDKRNNIKEIQRLLYEISYYNPKVPFIIPDGIYGPETVGAVKIFQQEYGLPPSGAVDTDTFDKLVEIHKSFYKFINKPDVFKADMVLLPGNAGPVIYFVQVMLNTISSYYANIPSTDLNGIYDRLTELAVNSFKKVTGNHYKEGIDTDLWNDIVSKFNSLV